LSGEINPPDIHPLPSNPILPLDQVDQVHESSLDHFLDLDIILDHQFRDSLRFQDPFLDHLQDLLALFDLPQLEVGR